VSGLLALGLTLAACRGESAPASATPPAASTPQHIDSAVPRDVALAQFRAPLGAEVSELATELRSRDALVDRYVALLAKRDTVGLANLALSKAEFAWLYYPTNPISLPPYDLAPGLMWFQLEGNSRKGLLHALEERGGRDLKVVGYRCERTTTEGENRIHERCALRRVQAPGDTIAEILFGGIIERHGRFKLIGHTNKL
jgi:hypothetical protein